MKGNNQVISEKLQVTNDFNATYCDLYEGVLNQHIGQTTDYVSILSELKMLSGNLKQEIHECRNIYTENNKEAEQVLEKLIDYQELLDVRINSFIDFVNKLYVKSNGGKYSFFSYNSDLKNLKKLEKNSGILGERLQIDAVIFMRKNR